MKISKAITTSLALFFTVTASQGRESSVDEGQDLLFSHHWTSNVGNIMFAPCEGENNLCGYYLGESDSMEFDLRIDGETPDQCDLVISGLQWDSEQNEWNDGQMQDVQIRPKGFFLRVIGWQALKDLPARLYYNYDDEKNRDRFKIRIQRDHSRAEYLKLYPIPAKSAPCP